MIFIGMAEPIQSSDNVDQMNEKLEEEMLNRFGTADDRSKKLIKEILNKALSGECIYSMLLFGINS